MKKVFCLFFSVLILVCGNSIVGRATVLTQDTVWSGTVVLAEDIIVPKSITLKVSAGARIEVKPSESTKIDPESLSHLTEITIRGIFLVEGTGEAPVVIAGNKGSEKERWAGIIVDGGEVALRHTRVEDAEVALHVVDGILRLDAAGIADNHYGVIGHGGKTRIHLGDSAISRNDYGVMAFNDAAVERQTATITGNRKKDYNVIVKRNTIPEPIVFTVDRSPIPRTYGDETLVGETQWRGHILITGVVRVSPGARLVVMPGTIVSFTKRDTNGDGIGENGIMIQGQLIAKATPKEPIVFQSAEKNRQQGDWDAINILGSDRGQNLLEYIQIEDAYRGVHFHFSNVVINHAIFRNNYRGAQFQESLVSIQNTVFRGNKSAIQARDSEVIFSNNFLYENLTGANFFRVHLEAYKNRIIANSMDGLRIREGEATVEKNSISGNRFGLLVADAAFGSFRKNLLVGNIESGLALRNSDHLVIEQNVIEASGINGMVIRDTHARIEGNLIAANAERGIGILSFSGVLKDNAFLRNGLYAIGMEGQGDVDATGNSWGGSDLDKEIYDHHDEERLGEVKFMPQLGAAPVLPWVFPLIDEDLFWGGRIDVSGEVTVARGATLTLLPGAVVQFGEAGGMNVLGKIIANGTTGERIVFSSKAGKGAGDWNELKLEYAEGSSISFCDFANATWGLHVHFSPMTISSCRFTNNDGGIRFRGGPVMVENNLFRNNNIGMRANIGVATIRQNLFTGNDVGIFVSNKGGGVKIHKNNFTGNRRYALRLGDFNQDDVDAKENWWGGVAPESVIFDGLSEDGVGTVFFDPPLASPEIIPIAAE